MTFERRVLSYPLALACSPKRKPVWCQTRPVPPAAEFELRVRLDESYAQLVERVATVLTTDNPWAARPWDMLLIAEDDKPVNRAVGFWARYGPRLQPGAEVAEAARSFDGRLLKVGARAADTPAQFVRVLMDPQRTRFYRATLLPSADEQVGKLLDLVLEIPSWQGYEFHWSLGALASSFGCAVMAEDETERHVSCLWFSGDAAAVAELRALVEDS